MEGCVDLGVGYIRHWFTCFPIVAHLRVSTLLWPDWESNPQTLYLESDTLLLHCQATLHVTVGPSRSPSSPVTVQFQRSSSVPYIIPAAVNNNTGLAVYCSPDACFIPSPQSHVWMSNLVFRYVSFFSRLPIATYFSI